MSALKDASGKIPIIDHDLLKLRPLMLSRLFMANVGASAQTLAVIRWSARQNKEQSTFKGIDEIARELSISERQVSRHLNDLVRRRIVSKIGRERLGNTNMLRRTVTYKLHPKVNTDYEQVGFNQLPLWFCQFVHKWGERAVLSCIVARYNRKSWTG